MFHQNPWQFQLLLIQYGNIDQVILADVHKDIVCKKYQNIAQLTQYFLTLSRAQLFASLQDQDIVPSNGLDDTVLLTQTKYGVQIDGKRLLLQYDRRIRHD